MKKLNEKEYIKGFNEGYLISKDLPNLAIQLSKTETTDSRGQGLRDGIEQFDLEKSKSRIPESFKTKRGFEKNKKDERERDIDLEK